MNTLSSALQAHMAQLPAPMSDYVTDTRSVLDQSLRILQAMTDVAADAGWLATALSTMQLVQSLMQVRLLCSMQGSNLPQGQTASALRVQSPYAQHLEAAEFQDKCCLQPGHAGWPHACHMVFIS